MRIFYSLAVMAVALAATAATAVAQQGLPDAFDGRFRGTLAGTGGAVSGEFTVTIARSDSGFTVTWPPRITARFEPASSPGVFRTRDKAQILHGDPVYWARLDGDSLIVYAAQIGQLGGYHIDYFAYSPADDGLDLVIRRVVTGAEPQVSRGRLSRYGG